MSEENVFIAGMVAAVLFIAMIALFYYCGYRQGYSSGRNDIIGLRDRHALWEYPSE